MHRGGKDACRRKAHGDCSQIGLGSRIRHGIGQYPRRRAEKSLVFLRRFPPPWTVEELAACFIVRDNTGQGLVYVYFEEEPGRRSDASLLTKDEARRFASYNACWHFAE